MPEGSSSRICDPPGPLTMSLRKRAAAAQPVDLRGNVVDHQLVLLQFADGLTASLTMHGASLVEGRTLRIDGMRATLFGNEARTQLEVHDHLTGRVETLHPVLPPSGHGGGDAGVLHDFLQTLQKGQRQVLTSAADSLLSHLLAFAAEDARLTKRVIDVDAYWAQVGA